MKKSLIALALFAALVLTTFTACSGDTDDGAVSDTSSAETTSGEEVTTEPAYVLPTVDLGGETFRIYLWTGSYIPATEETGDVINDAIYARNMKVEEDFNLKFEFDARVSGNDEYDEWYATLESTILSGDNTYQLVGGKGYRLVYDSLGTYYHNLNDIEALDFTQPWWPSNITEAGKVGSKMFICFGDFEPNFYDANYCVYFNKKLAESFGLNDLYASVNDYTWTFDKLTESAAVGAADLDGNGSMTLDDQYGMLMPRAMALDAFVQAFDIKITETDSEGMPRLLGVTQKYADAIARVNNFVHNSGVVGYNIDGLGEDKLLPAVFMPGRALFTCGSITMAHTLRSMEDDFGILPYPMYDEEQGEYITYNAVGNSTGMIIPFAADAETSGAILNALAYYGNSDVLPEYYERALQGKGTRDDDSAEMLDIIFSNVEFDFTQYYSFCFGDQKAPSMHFRMLIRDNKDDIASAWARDQQIYDATMEMIIEALK